MAVWGGDSCNSSFEILQLLMMMIPTKCPSCINPSGVQVSITSSIKAKSHVFFVVVAHQEIYVVNMFSL